MMGGKEDLGLTLSLNSSEDHHHRFPALQLNLATSSMVPSQSFLLHQKAPQWHDLILASSERSSSETRSFLKGIDVNRTPTAEMEMEEEAGVSSPNSTISSLSGKRGDRDLHNGEDNEIDRACSRGISDEEDGDGSRKKLRLSKDQSAVLEERFKEHNTLNPKQKMTLAKQLGLRPRQVEVWFQNRRARTKLKQTEVDCEFLKRCCENLTEENRRLQKEVQELRALKLSPQFYMHMTPPTTLTMCPSCERVATAATTSAPQPDNRNRPPATSKGGNPHQQYHNHRPISIAAGTGPTLPWAPTPIRPAAFPDAPSARS